MYIPWMAEFLEKFPPPKILRDSQYKTFQVALTSTNLIGVCTKRHSKKYEINA